ncbi:MAG: hypothetical protein K2J17_07190, partial [Paramuribaculum sp.]|nr:hypothetical protein [Paramuribaculum sp.]
PDDPANKPSASIIAGNVEQTSLTFTVTPVNAEKCAWACLAPGEPVPSAQEILANELNVVSATEPTFVEVTGLTAGTEYTIVAAATDGTIATVSAPVKMLTLDVNSLVVNEVGANVSGGFGATREASIVFRVGGDDQVVIPVLYDSKLKYMPAGTYTVGSTDEPGIIDNSNYTYCHFYYGGEILEINDGTMTVDIVNDEYDIDFRFTTDAGEFKLTYKGEIPGIAFYFDLSILSEARRDRVEGEVAGQYCIKLLEGSARNEELTLNFYADPSSTTLPAGTYTAGTSTNPGSLGPGTEFMKKTPTLTTEELTSGTVVVTKNGDDYTFDIKLYNEEGYEYKGTFTGKVAYMVRDDDDPSDMTIIDFNRWRYVPGKSDQAAHKAAFYLISTNNDFLNLVVYTNSSEVFLPAGTYTVGTGTEPGTIEVCKDTSLEHKVDGKFKAEQIAAGNGKLTVTVDGDTYTMVMDLTVESGKYRCKYTGDFQMQY